jgi:hypothetical protein
MRRKRMHGRKRRACSALPFVFGTKGIQGSTFIQNQLKKLKLKRKPSPEVTVFEDKN